MPFSSPPSPSLPSLSFSSSLFPSYPLKTIWMWKNSLELAHVKERRQTLSMRTPGISENAHPTKSLVSLSLSLTPTHHLNVCTRPFSILRFHQSQSHSPSTFYEDILTLFSVALHADKSWELGFTGKGMSLSLTRTPTHPPILIHSRTHTFPPTHPYQHSRPLHIHPPATHPPDPHHLTLNTHSSHSHSHFHPSTSGTVIGFQTPIPLLTHLELADRLADVRIERVCV